MQSSALKGVTSMYHALFTGPAWDHREREPGGFPGTSGIVFGWLIIVPERVLVVWLGGGGNRRKRGEL